MQAKDQHAYQHRLQIMKSAMKKTSFAEVRSYFANSVTAMKEDIHRIQTELMKMFAFLAENCTDQEILLAVTQLTIDENSARFISLHGCDEYYKYNQLLMTEKRNAQLFKELEEYKKQYSEEIAL